MHDVFPPQRTVFGPGVATDPRQPQITHAHDVTNLLAPPDCDDPDELVLLGEERERRHPDLALDSVEARHRHILVRGPTLLERDPRRPLILRSAGRGSRAAA